MHITALKKTNGGKENWGLICNGMLSLLAQGHQFRPDLSLQSVTYLPICGNK